jgi:hypothetical protein
VQTRVLAGGMSPEPVDANRQDSQTTFHPGMHAIWKLLRSIHDVVDFVAVRAQTINKDQQAT